MQTPKSRNSSSASALQKNSPRSVSSESSLKNSPQAAASSESSKKVSPRVVRQLKTGSRYSDHASNVVSSKLPKERSPKVSDHRSPKSLAPQTKSPSRVSELEYQVSQLEKDLNTLRDQLRDTEVLQKQAEKDAEEAKQQILAPSLKFETSQKKFSENSASKEAISGVSQEQEQSLKSNLEAAQKQHSRDEFELASALEEIEQSKIRLETHYTNPETEPVELSQLRQELSETLLLVEDMKNQLGDSKESEAQAKAMVDETLMHLANAKKMVDVLRSDGFKATGDYDAMVSELEKSKARSDYLEELVSKLKAKISSDVACDKFDIETKVYTDETEVSSAKLEVKQLRSALEAAEIRYNEEQARSAEDIKNAFEMAEKIKSEWGQREAELESELKKSKCRIEELKANLMDKETELQGICEENEGLTTKLEKSLSGQREQELERELEKSKADIENLKAVLSDKEIELQNTVDEHEKLKSEIKEISTYKENDDIVSDIDYSARVSEGEALAKVGSMMQEIEKSNRKVARIAEELEAAQAANADMEAEMRRLKVQSLQWRKAAEAAAAMISAGANNNWQIMERTGSMDNQFSPNSKNKSSPYGDERDEDMLKKKNANGLRRFWKKPHK